MHQDHRLRTASPRQRRGRTRANLPITRGRVGRRRTTPRLPRIDRAAFVIPPDLLMDLLAGPVPDAGLRRSRSPII